MSVWLVGLLIVFAPFDIAEVPFYARLEILPPYGLITFVTYVVLVRIQNVVFRKKGSWLLTYEIAFILFFNTIVMLANYIYYKSDIINGTNSFVVFALRNHIPIFLFLLPTLLFVRWFVNKKITVYDSKQIVLKGENKLDLLQLALDDLVSVASADNYVEVCYRKEGSFHKKLLRTTLKNIHDQIPELIKTHRSYLVNPDHIHQWKDRTTLSLTQGEIPVSKKYKEDILKMHSLSS